MLFRGSDMILSLVRIGRGHLLNEGAVWVAVSLKSYHCPRPPLLEIKELQRSTSSLALMIACQRDPPVQSQQNHTVPLVTKQM